MRVLLFLILCILVTLAAPAASIRIQVTDSETGDLIPARGYLSCDGRPVQPEDRRPYQRGEEQHFLLTGNDTLELTGEVCRLRVERGLEYQPVQTEFDPTGSQTVQVRLPRWAWMNRDGWYSADMHVHRNPEEMSEILLAEDLNFAPTITYHVWSEQVSRPFEAAAEFPVQVDKLHFYTANSQEVERIQGGPGAVILLAEKLPFPFQGTEFYPPNVVYTRQAHAQGGYVEGDKLFWLDTPVNVALGEIDFIELNCNHFLPHDVDTDLPTWSHWPVEFGYFGDHAFALWMMDMYYRYLNSGFKLPLSAGSASGVKATPVGYDRVYVFLGEEKLTYENYLEALKAGRSFTTNGPVIDFKIDGQLGPGSETILETGNSVRLEGVVKSRREIQEVQLMLNGRVWKHYSGEGRKEISIQEEIPITESSWVALRAFEPGGITEVFAHTSPAYLLIQGRPVRIVDDAALLSDQVEKLIDYTRKKGVFQSPKHLEETIELYRKAQAVYQGIISRGGR